MASAGRANQLSTYEFTRGWNSSESREDVVEKAVGESEGCRGGTLWRYETALMEFTAVGALLRRDGRADERERAVGVGAEGGDGGDADDDDEGQHHGVLDRGRAVFGL